MRNADDAEASTDERDEYRDRPPIVPPLDTRSSRPVAPSPFERPSPGPLAEQKGAEASTKAAPGRHKRRRLSRRARQVRGVMLAVVFVLFAAMMWSYAAALTAPGSTSAGTRTVEWISDKVPGGRAVVLYVERRW